MNQEKRKSAWKQQPRPGIFMGGPTVLTVLVVLCFACFALLTLSRAQTDASFSQRAAQTVTDFYQADATAEEVLALCRQYQQLPPDELAEKLQQREDINAVWNSDSGELALSIPAGTQGGLYMQLRLLWQGEETETTVLQRLIRPNEDPPESTLPVYTGD